MADVYLTKDEVAKILSISVATVTRFMKGEGLPFIKIGRHVRIPVPDLQKWLKERTYGSDRPYKAPSKKHGPR